MKVVILCGGKGTRSYPFTEYFPKAMMPINGSPIIVHLMKIFSDQGFDDFILAAGHRREILQDYFNGRFGNWRVNVLDTGDDSDTGERIRRCSHLINSSFFATYVDGLGDVDLHALLRDHKASGAQATVTSVPLRSQYGTLEFDAQRRVREFREKPVIADYWINAGYFVFEKEVFSRWHGQNLESEVLPELARMNQLNTYQHHGFWKSMDTSKDQQELEHLFHSRSAPWVVKPRARAVGAD